MATSGRLYRPAELPQLPDGEKRYVKREYKDISEAMRAADEEFQDFQATLGDAAFLDVGTTAGTVAAGDDSRIVNAVPNTRQVISGGGLTGGGNLTADRTLAVGAGTGITVNADDVALANMAQATIKGRASGAGTGAPSDLSGSQVRTIAGVEYGKQSFWVPANAWELGTAARGSYTDGSGHVWPTLDFDQTTGESVFFSVGMPKNWDLGNVTFYVYWTAASGSGGVAWQVNLGSVQDNESLGDAYSTGALLTDTFQTANNLHISPESGSLVPSSGGESVATHDCIKLQFLRDPSNGGDTLNADARMIGVKFIYNTSLHTDD